MSTKSAPYVRYIGFTGRDPGWWHFNDGGERTRCGIKLPVDPKGLKHVEFADIAKPVPAQAGQTEFCVRCLPIY